MAHDDEARKIAESGRELALTIGDSNTACGIDDAYTHAHAIHIPTSHVTTHSIHAGSPRCVTYLWKEALIALAQGQNRSILEEEIKVKRTYEVWLHLGLTCGSGPACGPSPALSGPRSRSSRAHAPSACSPRHHAPHVFARTSLDRRSSARTRPCHPVLKCPRTWLFTLTRMAAARRISRPAVRLGLAA